MNNCLVRPATIEDALRIAEIHVRTWQCAYRGQMPDSLLDNLSVEQRIEKWKKEMGEPVKGTHAIVAEVENKIIGWCTGGVSRDEDATKNIGELYGIYIDPEYIGKGAGSALMKQMLSRLKKDGYKKVTLWVLNTNKKTRQFYEKKGWKVEGKTKEELRNNFTLHETRYIIDLE